MTVIEDRVIKEQEKKELKGIYRQVFNFTSGKKIIEDLSRKCYYDKLMYMENTNDLLFREGRRSVYLYILKMLQEDEV